MNLNELRAEIDAVNLQILALYERRMDLAGQVAQYKQKSGLPVFQPEREKSIIEEVSRRADKELAPGAQLLFQTLMDVSKSHQLSKQSGTQERKGAALRRFLQGVLTAGNPLPERATVACQGISGANSHEAAKAFLPSPSIRYYPQFEDVFLAVDKGECEFGVLPVDNSTAGSVGMVYDLMRRFPFYICKTHKLPIRHCLLSGPKADFSTVTDVYSHEQALSQCGAFFRANPRLRAHVYSNTAAAAQYVSERDDAVCASISSEACAGLYSLNVLRDSIQDAHNNFTRFILISRDPIIAPGADKISLSLTLPHVTGSLYRLITRFATHSLNLTKLESRPLPETNFEFLFYFDFDGSVREERVLNLLCSLADELGHFAFLGNYS